MQNHNWHYVWVSKILLRALRNFAKVRWQLYWCLYHGELTRPIHQSHSPPLSCPGASRRHSKARILLCELTRSVGTTKIGLEDSLMWNVRKLRPVWCLLFTLPTAAVWQKKFIFKVFHSHSSTVGVVLLEGVRTNVNLEIYMSYDFEYIFAQMLPNRSLSFSTNYARNKLATPGWGVLS